MLIFLQLFKNKVSHNDKDVLVVILCSLMGWFNGV